MPESRPASAVIVHTIASDDKLKPLVIDPATGTWCPDLAPKQAFLFNSYFKFILASGPVRSGKTIACAHRILRHAWETESARIGIFARTVKSAFAGGVWSDLVELVLPIWLKANMGMRITKGPKVDGSTRLHHLRLSNMYGGESEIQLRSLDFDGDIESVIKSARFSCFWFSELSNFKSRIVFDTTTERLRMPHLREDAHLWISDTNPADEGEKFWAYKLFYTERLAEDHPFPDYQKKFQVVSFDLSDNVWLTESERNEIFARYAHDEDRRNRYCYGKWTTRTEEGLFSDVFMGDTHVLGNASAFEEGDWEVILPTETCAALVTGWDIGTSKNHSAHIIERIGAPGDKNSVFNVLDEAVSVGVMITIEDFVEVMLERWEFWMKYIRENCHDKAVEARHWSDTSAFNTFRAALGGFDHTVVAMASDGKFFLSGAPKSRGSVFKRVDLVRRLLFQNRLFVSARCTETIKMLGSLKAGKTKMEPVDRGTGMIHVFDSLSYALSSELVNELAETWSNTQSIGRVDGLVSLRL
jgi:PBSX family phage terminase large subunit